MGDRIRSRLGEIRESQHWLAKKVGIKQPSLNKVINAKNGESTKHGVAIAKHLGVSPIWLKDGTGPKFLGGEAVLVGEIGAGDKVYRFDEGVVMEGGIAPPAGYQNAIAARIKGHSMRPLEPGWLVFYEHEGRGGDPIHHANKLCAVGLRDGSVFIKKLRFSRGKWKLESWNAPTIENAEVLWASPIIEIRPV